MAVLSEAERTALIPEGALTRDGIDVPGTGADATDGRDLYGASCSVWALFGRFVADSADNHANQTYFNVFDLEDYDIGVYNHPRNGNGVLDDRLHGKTRTVGIPTGIAEGEAGLARYDARYAAQTRIIRDNVEQAIADSQTQLETFRDNGFNPALIAGANPFMQVQTVAQLAIKKALMTIAAGQAGLTVSNGATNYRLQMCTNAWYGWDHWALVVAAPSGALSITQTVPNTDVVYGCSTMWDEHYPPHFIYLNGISDDHAAVLRRVEAAVVH